MSANQYLLLEFVLQKLQERVNIMEKNVRLGKAATAVKETQAEATLDLQKVRTELRRLCEHLDYLKMSIKHHDTEYCIEIDENHELRITVDHDRKGFQCSWLTISHQVKNMSADTKKEMEKDLQNTLSSNKHVVKKVMDKGRTKVYEMHDEQSTEIYFHKLKNNKYHYKKTFATEHLTVNNLADLKEFIMNNSRRLSYRGKRLLLWNI